MYELTLVLRGSLDDKKLADQLEKLEKILKDAQGKVNKREDWGKKILAQTVKKNKEGIYVFYHLELEEARVNPIARLIENEDNILRHLLIKGDQLAESPKVQEKKEDEPKKEVKVKAKKDVKTKTKTKAKKK